jgi:hypothetical protein
VARLWIALLLALSLLPSSAAAGERAPVERPDEIHSASDHYGRDVLRSTGGLEIVWRLQAHGHGCSGGCSHRGSGKGPAPQLFSGSEPLLLHVRLLVGPGAADVDDSVVPLCERLPYHATAPPSLR